MRSKPATTEQIRTVCGLLRRGVLMQEALMCARVLPAAFELRLSADARAAEEVRMAETACRALMVRHVTDSATAEFEWRAADAWFRRAVGPRRVPAGSTSLQERPRGPGISIVENALLTDGPLLFLLVGDSLHLGLHPGQAKAWQSDRRFVFVVAGTQGGKTSFGPWWLAREIARRGPGDYLAVSSTVDLARVKMLPALRETFEWVLHAGEWRASERILALYDPATGAFPPSGEPWGRIILRSAAADGGLESATAKAAWLDECGQDEFTVETWEAVLRRLSLAQGRVLGTTTPYNEGWLKTEVYDRWQAGDERYDVVQFDSTLNPAFPQEEFERARESMPGWRFGMFYRGRFERPGGLVFEGFDPIENVVDDMPIPCYWPVEVGIDFGAVNTATVWVARDKCTGMLYVFKESLRGGMTTVEHAQAVLEEGKDYEMEAYWGGSPSESQQRSDWCEAGVFVYSPVVPDLESGIDRLHRLFKERKLKVLRSCEGLLAELAAYRRRLDSSGMPTEEIVNRAAFHRLDALRYVAVSLECGRATYGPPLW